MCVRDMFPIYVVTYSNATLRYVMFCSVIYVCMRVRYDMLGYIMRVCRYVMYVMLFIVVCVYVVYVCLFVCYVC